LKDVFIEKMITKKQIEDAIKPVFDPEIGVSLFELGLIYAVEAKMQLENI